MRTVPAPSPPMLPLCFCIVFAFFETNGLFSINFIESNSTTFRKYDGGGKYALTINCLRKGHL